MVSRQGEGCGWETERKTEDYWCVCTKVSNKNKCPIVDLKQALKRDCSTDTDTYTFTWSLATGIGLNGNVRFREHPVVGLLVPDDLKEDQTVKGYLRKATQKELKGSRSGDKVNCLVEVTEEPGENHHSTKKIKINMSLKSFHSSLTSCLPLILP